MQTDNLAVLTEAFRDIVEQTAFMFAEPVEPQTLPVTDLPFVQATMTFTGPLRGSLTIAMPESACAELAGNVLGMDPQDEFVRQGSADALKELLNVTCGHILTGMAGDRPIFDLSIPQVFDLDAGGVQALLAAPGTLAYLVDSRPALVRLDLREG